MSDILQMLLAIQQPIKHISMATHRHNNRRAVGSGVLYLVRLQFIKRRYPKISPYTNVTLSFDFDLRLDHPIHGGYV
jgi:hypothetical protein